MREIRMLRSTGRGLETEPWIGMRHRRVAKAAGNSYSPYLHLPRQPSTLTGYRLVSFLEKNFEEDAKDSFYLFIACDGYRSLFSGTELFKTAAGSESLIVTEMDGEPPHGGFMLGPVRDYFIDRDVWGLSHIVQLKP